MLDLRIDIYHIILHLKTKYIITKNSLNESESFKAGNLHFTYTKLQVSLAFRRKSQKRTKKAIINALAIFEIYLHNRINTRCWILSLLLADELLHELF